MVLVQLKSVTKFQFFVLKSVLAKFQVEWSHPRELNGFSKFATKIEKDCISGVSKQIAEIVWNAFWPSLGPIRIEKRFSKISGQMEPSTGVKQFF